MDGDEWAKQQQLRGATRPPPDDGYESPNQISSRAESSATDVSTGRT